MSNTPDDPNAPKPGDDANKPVPEGNKKPTDSDSAINLGVPPEGVEGSGISVIEWASLVEETAAQAAAASEPAQASPPPDPHKAPPTDAAIDLPPVTAPPTDVAIDLPAEAVVELPDDLPRDGGEQANIAAADAVVAEVVPDSSVHLGEPARPTQPPSTEDSAIDFGADIIQEPVVGQVDSAIDLPEGSVIEEAVEPVRGSDSAIDLGPEAVVVEEIVEPPAILGGNDSAIDLPQESLAGENLSGDSAVDLGADAIVEELVSPSSHGGDSAIEIPAENIILEDELDQPPPAPVTVSAAESAVDTPVEAAVLEDDFFADEAGSRVVPPTDSSIDLAAEAVVEDFRGTTSAKPLLGSEVPGVGSPAEMSEEGIDLASVAPGESGIDLSDIVPPTEGGSGVPSITPGESGIDLIAEDVILEEPVAPAAGGSSRDLIAEGLESGVGLLGQSAKKPVEESEDGLDDFLAAVGSEDQSSSVDLGSMHTLDVFQGDQSSSAVEPAINDKGEIVRPDGTRQPAAGDIDNVVLEEEEEGIDLGALAEPSVEGIELDAIADSPSSQNVDLGSIEIDMGAQDAPVEPAISEEDIDLDALDGPEVEPDEVDVDAVPTTKKRAAEIEQGDEVVDVEPEEAPKKPKKPTPGTGETPPRRRGGLLVGTALGLFLGTAASLCVWLFGVEPPKEWRGLVHEYTGMGQPLAKDGKKDGGGGGPPPVTFAQLTNHIKSGDLDKVTEADLQKADANDAAQLVARADWRWLGYLKAQKGKDLKADAPAVVQALEDLNKAVEKGNADALLLRGQIYEMTGKPKEARADYDKGLKDFAADAAQKERFEAALLAIELGPKITGLVPPHINPRVLAMALIHLQVIDQQPAQPGQADPEAGFAFWKAVKAARDGKHSEAIKLIDDAKSRHETRRFQMLRKQQNPLSDPREEIFLRVCDDLKAYWALKGKLVDPNYLAETDKMKRDDDIDALLKKADGLSRTAVTKEIGEKLYKDKVKDKPAEKVEDVIKLVADERKDLNDKITTHETTIGDQKKEIAKLSDEKKDALAKLKTTTEMLDASQKTGKNLRDSLDTANTTLEMVAEVVNVKFKDAKTSGPTVIKEVKNTARIAKIVDPKGTIRQLEGELEIDRARLKERWEPAQMLPIWLAVLEGDRSRKDLHPSILKDVQRVQNDADARDADKTRAKVVKGLVERNEEKFADAAATLKPTREALADNKDLLKIVDAALAEVSNPGATFARRATDLLAQNRPRDAMAVLKRGFDVADKKGPLYALRAQIAFDAVKSKGALEKDDPDVKVVQDDARKAADEGLAEGHYLLGLLAEELGQPADAIKSYDAAIAANKEDKDASDRDANHARYLAAKARTLLKIRGVDAQVPKAAPPRERTGKATPKADTSKRVTSVDRLETLAVLLMLTFQPAPGLPNTGPNVKEAEKLADEIIAMGNKAPFDALAGALAVKGLYTRALNVYLAGLREKGLLAPKYANGLLELVRDHPGLKRPESLIIPDPTAGEKHYGSGRNFFADRKYREAEREFLAAVEADNGDARYFYYLGLSQLAQGKRDAYENFDEAAKLERLGRPDRAAVSQALERVQGPMRKALNDVRNRPVKERLK